MKIIRCLWGKDNHKFIEELRNNSEWDLVNLKNFRIFEPKASSTGLALLIKR